MSDNIGHMSLLLTKKKIEYLYNIIVIHNFKTHEVLHGMFLSFKNSMIVHLYITNCVL